VGMLIGLLINLLFILILILLLNMFVWYKHKSLQHPIQRIYLFIVAVLQIIICLLLSVPEGEGFIYDLRFIPMLLGGLYGGKRVTIALAAFLLIIRYFIGGDGFMVSVSLTLTTSFLIIFLGPYFIRKTIRTRVIMVTVFSFFYSIIGYLIPSIIFDFQDMQVFAIYSVVLTASTFFVSYLTEILRQAYHFHLEAMKLEKMEIVSHLAASISHEVRNPLTAVAGFLQLIAENEITTDTNREYAKYAIDEANRASEIINDYLMFAKPHPNDETIMNVNQEIQKSIDILKPLCLKQNIQTDISFDHKAAIKGDPHKFQQVLINIFKNSIEAMPKGGNLTIYTAEEKEKISIKISDTGHGMTPEHLARLGEPYFSLKGQKGTGLGMMVVFRIVESMKGHVQVNSKYNLGTSITLTFPKH
jgi:two-component system, sporulation sensor kinase B